MSKVFVVTGANKGIGKEVARRLLEQVPGCHVVITSRSTQNGEAAITDLQTAGTAGSIVSQASLDLTDDSSIAALAADLKDRVGGIDGLICNAGFAFKGADPTPFGEQAGPTFATNYYGTRKAAEALVPLLKPQARVVFLASQAGSSAYKGCSPVIQKRWAALDLTVGKLDALCAEYQAAAKAGTHKQQGWPGSNYGASKLAVINYTRVLARQLDGKALVNSCCPGYCATDMSSHRGTRSAYDGADTAVWLALLPGVANDSSNDSSASPSGRFFFDREDISPGF